MMTRRHSNKGNGWNGDDEDYGQDSKEQDDNHDQEGHGDQQQHGNDPEDGNDKDSDNEGPATQDDRDRMTGTTHNPLLLL
jgi:hypothetical protein